MEGVIAVTLVLKQKMIQFWFHYVIARGVVKCLEQLILEQHLENSKLLLKVRQKNILAAEVVVYLYITFFVQIVG